MMDAVRLHMGIMFTEEVKVFCNKDDWSLSNILAHHVVIGVGHGEGRPNQRPSLTST